MHLQGNSSNAFIADAADALEPAVVLAKCTKIAQRLAAAKAPAPAAAAFAAPAQAASAPSAAQAQPYGTLLVQLPPDWRASASAASAPKPERAGRSAPPTVEGCWISPALLPLWGRRVVRTAVAPGVLMAMDSDYRL